jgi:hypothetical protein
MTSAAHHRCMMTQQLRFSILSAPLAAIDRRALSQAWYSALHLAKASRSPEIAMTPRSQSERRSSSFRARDERPAKRAECASGARIRVAGSPVGRDCASVTERRTHSVLARKIQMMLLSPARSARRATFSIDGTSARVHVTLRILGGQVRLIAFCPPPLRARVARALEEARYALASRGIAFGFETKEQEHDG